jgi:peptide/nickel transport system permease protein
MTTETQALQEKTGYARKAALGTLGRVLSYTGLRFVSLFLTVVVGVYLTIMIANMGGYVDQIMRSEIRERFTQQVAGNPAYRDFNPDERRAIVEELIALEEDRLDLNTPVAIRTARYLGDALQMKLGRAMNMTSDNGSRTVRLIILERLPATLLLQATANFVLFFGSLFLALILSRNYGSFWDKMVIALSPTSAAPAWFYGIFLILIFAAIFQILPFSGMVSAPPPENKILYALSVLKHLILPASSLIFSALFLTIYGYRTFFLVYSSEDYVEMGKAKGLPARDLERRYILRPTLPTIITNFALLLIGMWQGSIITETVFLWPGLGRTIFQAIGLYDIPVIVGTTIIYAYLLAITVFLLEIVYVLVDPRVKIGSGG